MNYRYSVMKLEIQWCILFLRFQTLLGIKYSKTIYDFVLEDYESAETSNRKVLGKKISFRGFSGDS